MIQPLGLALVLALLGCVTGVVGEPEQADAAPGARVFASGMMMREPHRHDVHGGLRGNSVGRCIQRLFGHGLSQPGRALRSDVRVHVADPHLHQRHDVGELPGRAKV